MMNYFEKIKSKLPQPFWSSSPPQPSECLDDVNVRRLTHLWDQIVELENRVSVQQKEITLTDDGVSSLNEIKRRLVRARDIRYKTSLLKLELSRCGSLANETNANWEKYEERKKKETLE